MGYYSYYKRKKKTKPFKFIQHKVYKVKPKKSYQELKQEDESLKDSLNPITEDAFVTILKAALNYAKYSKN